MMQILRDPVWQGVGVIIAVLFGLVGLIRNKTIWLLIGVAIAFLTVGMVLGSMIVLNREQIPMQVSVFHSEDGQTAADFTASYHSDGITRYDFTYDLPLDANADVGAGLQFYFTNVVDLSKHKSIDFMIQFCQPDESLELVLIDVDGTRDSIHISSDGLEPSERSVALDRFKTVNLHAVRILSFFTMPSYNTGHHEVAIQNVHFIK